MSPIDSVWSYFNVFNNKAQCKNCNTFITARACRLRNHMLKCFAKTLKPLPVEASGEIPTPNMELSKSNQNSITPTDLKKSKDLSTQTVNTENYQQI